MKAANDFDLNFNATLVKQEANYLPWLVCFCASLFFFYEFIQMNMFNAINTQLMQEFSLTAAGLGYMSASYFYSSVLFLFPAGLILDRFSTKKLVLTALSICTLGTFLFANAHSVALATFCRFITGIGSAFCFLSCVRLASRWFPAERMALITGLVVTMAMIGGMAAQAPLTLLVNNVGWRSALEFDSLLGLIIILTIFTFVRDYPAHLSASLVQERNKLSQFGYWQSMRHAFLSKQNWFCGIYTSLLNLPLFLLGGLWGSLYLNAAHHIDRTNATQITGMVFFGTIIGAPLMGWLSDKLGRRKMPMLLGAVFSLAIVFAIMFSVGLSFWTLMILFFLLGLLTSTQVISYPTVTESNTKMLTATCVSVVSICAISGGAIFEPLFGWLMDYHWSGVATNGVRQYAIGDFQFAMWLFPIGILVAFAVAAMIKETFCKQLTKEP
jgi:MFS family permease